MYEEVHPADSVVGNLIHISLIRPCLYTLDNILNTAKKDQSWR